MTDIYAEEGWQTPPMIDIEAPPAPETDDAELGSRARLTRRQAVLIANGINPATRRQLHADAATERTGPGLRCRDCAHLYVKTGDFAGCFLKCAKAAERHDVQGDGPDARAWWPACTAYEPTNRSTR